MIRVNCVINGVFCGKCCYNTEMPLTEEDVERIESLGYSRRDFAVKVNGIYRLRNVNGKCYFLDDENRCKIYDFRPIGCRIYPVILDLEGGAIVDDICPRRDEINVEEVKRVELILKEIVRKIYGFEC